MTFKSQLLSCSILIGLGTAAFAQSTPTSEQSSYNMYGNPGLIDMPSAEMREDGEFGTSLSFVNQLQRYNISFQPLPWVHGVFRYSYYTGENYTSQGPTTELSDRSFDVRFRLIEETDILPTVSIGLRDFMGTGVYGGEYIAATKNIHPKLKVTAGLGWGRLSETGDRRRSRVSRGGTPNFDQWFRGPASPFGGIEWQTPIDRLTFKAEYSTDDYDWEDTSFNIESQFNAGLEYRSKSGIEYALYAFGGNEVAARIAFPFNLKSTRDGALNFDAAPPAIKPRAVAVSFDPNAFSGASSSQDTLTILTEALAPLGITVESLSVGTAETEIRIRNNRYMSAAQAVGRTMRVMANTLPAPVETFKVTIVEKGVPVSTVTTARSDLETLEFTEDGADAIAAVSMISGAPSRLGEGAVQNETLYPDFSWSINPYVAATLFENATAVKLELGIRANARYTAAPGLFFEGSVAQPLSNGRGEGTPRNSGLQPVRTNAPLYYQGDGPNLENLTANYMFKLGNETYGRFSAGYFETMFGGVLGEVLYKPANQKWGVGVEVAHVRQRAFDQGFDFQDYEITTGHASLYYALPNGFEARLDAGRYLAGDWGATLSVDRTFANGWSVGAFVSQTDVSGEDFGEGNFDKGLAINVPLSFISRAPSRNASAIDLRSLNRDGGARLNANNRLYSTVKSATAPDLTDGWGKFWR